MTSQVGEFKPSRYASYEKVRRGPDEAVKQDLHILTRSLLVRTLSTRRTVLRSFKAGRVVVIPIISLCYVNCIFYTFPLYIRPIVWHPGKSSFAVSQRVPGLTAGLESFLIASHTMFPLIFAYRICLHYHCSRNFVSISSSQKEVSRTSVLQHFTYEVLVQRDLLSVVVCRRISRMLLDFLWQGFISLAKCAILCIFVHNLLNLQMLHVLDCLQISRLQLYQQ